MARFTTSKDVSVLWRGLEFIGTSGTTHRLPDELYDEFVREFVTGKDSAGPSFSFPGLVWVSQDESTAGGAHPDLAAHDTLGLATQVELDAHTAAGDPHNVYALDADLANHEAAADPHAGYQRESEKGAASGYASLDGSTKVPLAQIATGTTSTTVALGSAVPNHEAAADPHTGYQRESEKGAASGYASLDGSTLVPVAQIGSGSADTTKFLRGDRSWQVPPSSGGAPTDADYLVGTANAGLSAEIVVGTTPGGELGGSWGSPTVDPTHSGTAHGDVVVRVVATDSHSDMIAATPTTYRCDGTADDVQIQAAIDSLPSLGGEVVLAPGTYTLAATINVNVNKRIRIVGYGAKINLAASVTGFKIAQGISAARGVRVEGVRIDGQSNASTVGIELEDTNNSEIIGVSIENCATGILLDSQATNNFVEGSLIDNCIMRDNTTGVLFSITSGTGSFMQTIIRGLRCVVGASGTGLVIPANALMLRAIIQANFWLDSNETGITIDGNMEDAVLEVGIEGAGGATANIGVSFGSSGTNLDQMYLMLKLTGTIATQISNTSSKSFRYMAGALAHVDTTGTVIDGWKRHGDTANRTQIENLTAGGKIQFGPGNAAVDTNLYRSAANVLSSDDKVDPASINLQTKTTAPVDGDIVGGAADGDVVLDTTNARLYARAGGAWSALGQTGVFSRGGTLENSAGISTGNRMVWRAPFACTVTNVRGHRKGGTGATVNAQRNQASTHLASAVSLSTADAWTDGGVVQNTAYAAGDDLEIMVVSVTGTVTEIAIQVDFTRP